MTTRSHMRRLMDVVDRARERAAEAQRMQAGAVTQLDTVEYELGELVRELEAAGIKSAAPAPDCVPALPIREVPADPPMAPQSGALRRAAG